MTVHRLFVLGVTSLLLALVFPVSAQEAAIAEGLLGPRGMAFDADGNLYVAEAGITGDLLTDDGSAYGPTGQVTMVTADGDADVFVSGFISVEVDGPRGVSDVLLTDDSIWVAVGGGADQRIPADPDNLQILSSVVELDRETGEVKTLIDTLAFERENDPDGNPNEESNPVDLALADDGTLYLVDASANSLLSWTSDDGLQVVTSWPFDTDNPVPTSIDIGPDGDIYVGFLSGFPFPEGGTRIERWSDGELVETFEGLTAVTGVLVTDDGTIFAVQHGAGGGDFGVDSGSVVTVDENGVTPVLENLNRPYGIEQGPDGVIYVTVNTVGDDGMVIALP